MTDYQKPELLALAFDQYQRYRLAAEVLDRVRDPGRSFDIIEIGGHPGYSRKFFPSDRVIVADMLSSGDSLDLLASAESLPFEDHVFPVALAVDVLEHIPPGNRQAALQEMARVSSELVLIAAPFDYSLARECERMVFDFIKDWLGYEHKYLKEHLESPAPDLVQTESELVRLGFDTEIFPNGYIERWLVMMLGYYYFEGFPRDLDLRKEITEFYNKNFFWQDLAEPAYRHLIVASRTRLREKPGALADLVSRKQKLPEPNYERMRLWLDLFVQGETRRLLERIGEMEAVLREKEEEIQNQKAYIAELEDFHKKVKGSLIYKIYRGLFRKS